MKLVRWGAFGGSAAKRGQKLRFLKLGLSAVTKGSDFFWVVANGGAVSTFTSVKHFTALSRQRRTTLRMWMEIVLGIMRLISVGRHHLKMSRTKPYTVPPSAERKINEPFFLLRAQRLYAMRVAPTCEEE